MPPNIASGTKHKHTMTMTNELSNMSCIAVIQAGAVHIRDLKGLTFTRVRVQVSIQPYGKSYEGFCCAVHELISIWQKSESP